MARGLESRAMILYMKELSRAREERDSDKSSGVDERTLARRRKGSILERVSAGAHELADGLLELAWPTRCVCCDLPGSLLCDDCRESLPRIEHESACQSCGAPHGRICCTECWSADGKKEYPFSSGRSSLELTRESSRLILSLKDHGERRIVKPIAELMAQALEQDLLETLDLMTFVPATSAAFRRRGFDHMKLIASELSEILGIECIELLESNQVGDQRDLTKEQRAENMKGAFNVIEGNLLEGRHILLVDDVFTTGSTLSSASSALTDVGAASVCVLTLYRAW